MVEVLLFVLLRAWSNTFHFSVSSWTDGVFGMCRLVPRHTVWPIYISPLPHHHLAFSEGEWTLMWTLASRAEAAISLFFMLIWMQITVRSPFCCCRLFRSMSGLSYSDWAALPTGSLKDQVDTPSNKLFCGGGVGVTLNSHHALRKLVGQFSDFLYVHRDFLCSAMHWFLCESGSANSLIWHPTTRGRATSKLCGEH